MAKKRTKIDFDNLPRTRAEAERLGMTGPKAAKRMREEGPRELSEEARIARRSRAAKRGAATRTAARAYSGNQRASRRASMLIEPYLHEVATRLGGGNFTRGVRLALLEAEERRAAAGKMTRESMLAELANLQNRIEELQEKM